MTHLRRRVQRLTAAAVLTAAAAASAKEKVLFNFEGDFDTAAVRTSGAAVSVVRSGRSSALRMTGAGTSGAAAVTLDAPEAAWDLSAFDYLAVDVRNVGPAPVRVSCRVEDAPARGKGGGNSAGIPLAAGGDGTIRVAFVRPIAGAERIKLFGMRGLPPALRREQTVEPGRLRRIVVSVAAQGPACAIEIDDVRAAGGHDPKAGAVTAEEFFPFIDEFGQYIHGDWPGKTHSVKDLGARRKAEADDLAARGAPEGWNGYGGWARGPRLEATGFFRAARHGGKWWLVDPEGRLFFSHGVDCVRPGAATPIDDRAAWFRNLPGRSSAFGECYGQAGHVVRDYYKHRRPTTFDFGWANLIRKYGQSCVPAFAEASHRRLRSWGLNTIGSWSDRRIYELKRTPYVVIVGSGGRPIAGSTGYWRQFSDVFDDGFAADLRKRMAGAAAKAAGDPWCLGFFVDNELSWGSETSLAAAALASPADQAAKKAFVADLKGKYGAIEKLNAAWGTKHASWDALLAHCAPPAGKGAGADLLAFNEKIVTEYFRTCRNVVKSFAPNQLYLGCRFAWSNVRVVKLAADYCDVLSFNLYRRTVADFRLPDGVDLPVLSGEFHFGALDRGMFHTGLVGVADQAERAEAYKAYVRSALAHPHIVGCHWFQYADQCTVGRPLDGENYQIGFVDVADTPYPESVEACRDVAARLYELRLGGAKEQPR